MATATRIKNLTPHPVNIYVGDKVTTFEPDGALPRIWYQRQTSWVAGVPLVKDLSAEIVDLPDPEPNTYLIVSGMVFEGCPERTDLLAPVQPIRGEGGRVIGCKMLRSR